jgi:hypothetical protein
MEGFLLVDLKKYEKNILALLKVFVYLEYIRYSKKFKT